MERPIDGRVVKDRRDHVGGTSVIGRRAGSSGDARRRLPTQSLLLIATLLHSDARWWFVLPKALGLVQQVGANDELASAGANGTAFVQKRALRVAVR